MRKTLNNMEEKDIRRIFEVFKAPFTYDEYGGGYIWDADNNMVGETRGWGYLQKLKDGAKIQDNVGKLIVELLNKQYEQIKTKNP